MKYTAFFVIFCAILGHFFAGAVNAQESQKILTVYYFHRPPYYVKPDGGKASGFLVEISRLVLETAGLPHRFVEMPPKRILKHIQKNEFSCSVGWFKTRERESFALFSRPIYQNRPIGVVMHKEKTILFPPKPSLSEILKSPLVLGVINGFSYGSSIDNQLAELRPKLESITGKPENLLKMIAKHRIDYALMAPEEAHFLIDRDPELAENVRFLELADAPPGNFRYLMFSKAVGPAVLEKVNLAVEKVVKSEAYAHLTGSFNLDRQ